MKILVIEDEEQIRDELMDWLTFEGYEALAAANGRRGLEIIYQERPDLILCDIAMPEMDGHEVLMEVRAAAAFNTTPFIFLTAAADRNAVRKGMGLGADDYLTKPFTHREVLEAIQSRLARKSAQDTQIARQIDLFNRSLIQESERHLFKSRLVTMLSHEFRNPLATILISSNIIRNYAKRISAERQQQSLDRIDGAIHQLTHLLDDALIIAEIEGGHLEYKPQPIVLPTLIQAIVEEQQLIDRNAHQLIFQNSLEHATEADPKLLRQILNNLLTNAIKYSPVGSTITVILQAKGDQILLVVQDQGIGIPEESLPHLFDPFYRTASAKNLPGTGLGLNIVKSCVEHHGGQIAVESQVGRGTTVSITLPLVSHYAA